MTMHILAAMPTVGIYQHPLKGNDWCGECRLIVMVTVHARDRIKDDTVMGSCLRSCRDGGESGDGGSGGDGDGDGGKFTPLVQCCRWLSTFMLVIHGHLYE
jgi:hypothetical protein